MRSRRLADKRRQAGAVALRAAMRLASMTLQEINGELIERVGNLHAHDGERSNH